jgi:acyl dehydratase
MSITVGQRASRSLTLTSERVSQFANISGDRNPLHFDAAFAARSKFGPLGVQGGLTTGLLHALRCDGHAGTRNGVPEPELEVHGSGVHR